MTFLEFLFEIEFRWLSKTNKLNCIQGDCFELSLVYGKKTDLKSCVIDKESTQFEFEKDNEIPILIYLRTVQSFA